MANIKCAACGFEEGERNFVPIAADKDYVFLVKSRGLILSQTATTLLKNC